MTRTFEEPDSYLVADFGLMSTKPGALGRFARLRADTNAYVDRLEGRHGHHLPWAKWPDAGAAGHLKLHLFDKMPAEHLDTQLVSRWTAWDLEYEEILRASPKWRMRELISEISEIEGHSWPAGREQDYWYWAAMPDGQEKIPFQIRDDLIDGYRDRLRSLILESGGFLYVRDEDAQITFATTEELADVWRRQKMLLPWERREAWESREASRVAQKAAERARYDPTQERFALVGLVRLLWRWVASKVVDRR